MKRATNLGAMIAIAVVLTLLGAGCEPSLLLDDIEEVVRAYGGQPGILIVQDGRNVDSGSGTHSFGPTEVGSTSEALFSIRNVGTEALILTGDPDYVQISGTDAADFSVMGNQPGSPVTDETTFVLGFSPSSLGSKSATVSIPNNDPDASQSPYVFSVTGAGVLAGSVATPNGGEAYRPGTNCEITWGVFEGAANVRIELLKAGLLDTTIANSTLDDGSYTWAIPSGQTGGNDYTVRITGVENPTLVDESDAAFAVGALEVLSPNGGDVLAKSGDLDITWDTGGLGGFVSIELHRDGSWAADIVASTENDGSYLNWPIPVSTTVADGYTIVIETVTPGSTVVDQSDAGFAVEQIVVTAPDGGGEHFTPGGSITVTWDSSGYGTSTIQLDRSGTRTTLTTNATNATGTFTTTVPAITQSTLYKAVVTSNDNGAIADTSDNYFAIGTISAVSPSGGSYEVGSATTIGWSSTLGGTVKLELMDGASVERTITASTANDGSFAWTVPADLYPNNNYKVRVSSSYDATISASSGSSFTASGWRFLGTYASSSGGWDISAVLNSSDGPTIAFRDAASAYRINVASWRGSFWVTRGPISDSGQSVYTPAVGDNAADQPTVMWRQGSSRQPYVKQDYPTDWTDLDSPIDVAANSCAVLVGGGWYPHIAWDFGGLNVSKLAIDDWSPYSTHWVSLGQATTDQTRTAKFASNPLDDSRPYLAYSKRTTSDKRCYVSKYAGGTTWTSLGPASVGEARYVDIATDDSDSSKRPFVVFADYANNQRAHVKRWSSGTSWTDYSYASAGAASQTVIECGSDGRPFVAYLDSSTTPRVRVTQWNGSSYVDMSSPGTASNDSIEILMPTDGLPIVVYTDSASPWRIRAAKRFE
jgi:hypothetical protein